MKGKKTGLAMKGAVSLAVLLLVLAVAGSFVASLLNISPAKELPTFKSCDEMAMTFSNARQQYAQLGWRGFGIAVPMMAESAGAADAAKAAPDYSTTNIQVEGVDEADIVKTDGTYIYTLSQGTMYYGYYERSSGSESGSKLIIAKAYPADDAEILSETKLEDFSPSEIFIEGDRMLIFGSRYESIKIENVEVKRVVPYLHGITLTTVQLWDISDRSDPKLVRSLDFEGSYLTSRKIGTDVYFVVNSYPRYYVLERTGLPAENAKSLIPMYRDSASVSKKLEPASKCTDVAYFEPIQAERFVTIASISMSDDDAEVKKQVTVGSGQNVYASMQNLYVAETVWPSWGWIRPLAEDSGGNASDKYQYTERTIVHKFSLDNGEISYEGNGEVFGHVLNQFSMDEYKGYFRIATTAGHVSRGGGPSSTNNVYVLGSDLKQVGKLEDLAPGEQIHSARFMGDRCYLVTFKKIDPFFVIDMRDPKKPKVLGKLKIPGYSDYLHPYDDNHIIGIGKETVEALESRGDFAWYQGLKMAIFDVSDVSNPTEMHKIVIGDRGTDSEVLRAHKAFLFDKDRNLLVIPILLAEIKGDKESLPDWTSGNYVYQGAYVYDLTLENGFQLRGRVTHYEDNETFLKSGYYFYGGANNVKRSLYIDDVLYTISGMKIKLNSLADLAEIKELPFAS